MDIRHNIKTPLTSIKGFTQLLSEDEVISDSDKRINYLNIINRNTSRLCKSVENLEKELLSIIQDKEGEEDG